jgi:hypothetical protein
MRILCVVISEVRLEPHTGISLIEDDGRAIRTGDALRMRVLAKSTG